MVPYLRLPEMSEDTLGPCVRLDPGNLSGYLLIKGGEQLGDREIRARVRGCVGLGIHAGGAKRLAGGGLGAMGFSHPVPWRPCRYFRRTAEKRAHSTKYGIFKQMLKR